MNWNEVPPRATAIELVEDRLYDEAEAGLFVEGFNRAAAGLDCKIWAVAVPIAVRYEGDVQPGMDVVGFVFAESSGEESQGATAVGTDSA